jgi:hypothetical protein
MLVMYGGASCVRDLGLAERPRADQEERNTEGSVFGARCLEHATPCCTESVALCPSPVGTASCQAGTSTLSRPGMAAVVGVGRRLAVCVGTSFIYLQHGARRRIGVFDEELIWARGGQRGCDNVSGHVLCYNHTTEHAYTRGWSVKKNLHMRRRKPCARRMFLMTKGASAVPSSNDPHHGIRTTIMPCPSGRI